ncbi:MAG TPA: acyl-CoA dehydrogenase family protein [Longimicrobium sp.]|jgi:alkylation response protein AidB-like acyl-CoA dehydrogenase
MTDLLSLPAAESADAARDPAGLRSAPGTDAPYAWSEGHRAFRVRVGRLVREAVLPHLDGWEREGRLPRELFRAAGGAGILGVTVPPEMGGAGLDYSYAVALAEELMRHRATSAAVSLMVQSNTLCPLLALFGSAEVRREWLAPLAAGEAIGALGATEPAGGSALPHTVSCTAVREGTEWVVTGEKMFITNAPIADVVLVLARTSPGAGPLTMSLIAVPTDAPGFETVAWHCKLGLEASPTGHVRLDRCRVPARLTVGRAGHGYPQMAHVLCHERLLIAVGSLALAGSVLEETAATSAPAAAAPLARMHAWLQGARAFAYRAAGEVGAGRTDAAAASMAKFALCELAQRVVDDCVRLRGPAAAWEDAGLERVIREVRVLSVFAGTSETMRELYGSRLAALMRRAALEGGEG